MKRGSRVLITWFLHGMVRFMSLSVSSGLAKKYENASLDKNLLVKCKNLFFKLCATKRDIFKVYSILRASFQKIKPYSLKLCILVKLTELIWEVVNIIPNSQSVQFSHSVVSDSAIPWTAACQASLSITNSQSSLRLMSIESVMPSKHLILCRPLLLLPSTFPKIRVFSNESVLCIRCPKDWSFSFNISPFNEYSGLICFKMD